MENQTTVDDIVDNTIPEKDLKEIAKRVVGADTDSADEITEVDDIISSAVNEVDEIAKEDTKVLEEDEACEEATDRETIAAATEDDKVDDVVDAITDSSITDDITKYFELLQLLKLFLFDPDTTISKIVNSEYEFKAEFNEISIAIKGAFTRSRAIENGKTILLASITKLFKLIVAKFKKAASFNSERLVDIESSLDNIGKLNIRYLENKKELYNADSFSVKYMSSKLSNKGLEVITSNIKADSGIKDVTIKEALWLLRTVLIGITDVVNNEESYDLSKALDMYNVKLTYIRSCLPLVGLGEFKSKYIFNIDDAVPPTIVDNADTVLANEINNILSTKREDFSNFMTMSEVEILDMLISDLSLAVNKIIDFAGRVVQNALDNKNTNTLFLEVMDLVNTKALKQYADEVIDAREFAILKDDYKIVIGDTLATEQRYLATVDYRLAKLTNILHSYIIIYNTVNELVDIGLMTYNG